jgi:hypothetical protein
VCRASDSLNRLLAGRLIDNANFIYQVPWELLFDQKFRLLLLFGRTARPLACQNC